MTHEYTPIIKRSNRSSIAITVNTTGDVIVKAPKHASDRSILQFISEQDMWIKTHLQRIPLHPKRTYDTGDTFYYLGNEVKLLVGNYTEIQLVNSTIQMPSGFQFMAQKQLTRWYKVQAKSIITEQVEHYAHRMQMTYRGLKFADTISQWGSCTHDNRLQFNWRLVMAPILAVNYVVIHELAHTVEKNHSKQFWKIVRAYCPSYNRQRAWLRTHQHTMTI